MKSTACRRQGRRSLVNALLAPPRHGAHRLSHHPPIHAHPRVLAMVMAAVLTSATPPGACVTVDSGSAHFGRRWWRPLPPLRAATTAAASLHVLLFWHYALSSLVPPTSPPAYASCSLLPAPRGQRRGGVRDASSYFFRFFNLLPRTLVTGRTHTSPRHPPSHNSHFPRLCHTPSRTHPAD